jgi:hypothetical protein
MGVPIFNLLNLISIGGSILGEKIGRNVLGEQPGQSVSDLPRPPVNMAAIAEMADRVDRLILVCMAMWTLLEESKQFTQEQLLEKIKEIDLRDGQADGKISPTVRQCPKCRRVMSQRHSRCLYCGSEDLNVRTFEKI